MSMVPVSPRSRSAFLANRLLLLSSVPTCKMAALQLLRQGNVMAPETIVVAPGFSQRVCNVIVRAALTRNTKDKHLF